MEGVVKKPDIFKMLDVKRKALLRLPVRALHVWLYYWMREGQERVAWASEEELCGALDMNRKTMRKWRNWLVENGWLKKMGYRNTDSGEFAVPRFRVKEGVLPETKTCPSDRAQNLVGGADQTLVNRPRPTFGRHPDQGLVEEVEPREVDTKEQVEPCEVEPTSVFLSVSPNASLRSAQHEPLENQNRNGAGLVTKSNPKPLTTNPEVVDLAVNYIHDPRLTMLFGLPGGTDMTPEEEQIALRIAGALMALDRSPSWLIDLVKWVRNGKSREAKFWNNGKLVTGDKGWAKLAEYLEKGTIAQQFDANLTRGWDLDNFNRSTYVLSNWE
jgi:hypothetical protein